MITKPFVQTIAVILIVGGLLASAGALQAVREARYPPPPDSEEAMYITSGTAMRRLTAGYNALAADLYWIRTIQYYGNVKLRLKQSREAALSGTAPPPIDYQLLYPMLDLTTS